MKRFLIIAVSLLLAGYVFADTGTLVETRTSMAPPQRIRLAWTATTGGIVTVTTSPLRGELSRVVFTNAVLYAPTGATYAVTLKDATGIDLLDGQGSTVSSNAAGGASQIIPGDLLVTTTGTTNLFTGLAVNDKLTLGITGAGSNAMGAVFIYLK